MPTNPRTNSTQRIRSTNNRINNHRTNASRLLAKNLDVPAEPCRVEREPRNWLDFGGAALCAYKSRRTDGYQWVPEPRLSLNGLSCAAVCCDCGGTCRWREKHRESLICLWLLRIAARDNSLRFLAILDTISPVWMVIMWGTRQCDKNRKKKSR
jgi:hypothetical protein